MADKIQRFRDGHFGMMPDDEGDFVSVKDVNELIDDAREMLFDSPQREEYENGVNALINLIKLGQ